MDDGGPIGIQPVFLRLAASASLSAVTRLLVGVGNREALTALVFA